MKKTLLFIVIAFIALILVGCSGEKDKKVASIELDQSTVPTTIKAYDFDLSNIHLLKKYTDGSFDVIELCKDYLDEENQLKLNTVGNQTIAFLYDNNAYVFSVTVEKGDPSLYLIETINVSITTTGNKYNVSATTQKNIDIYAEVNTNPDLLTATLCIVISPEFTFAENLNLNCTLDQVNVDTSNLKLEGNKVTLVFNDAFWSPLA